MFGSVLCDLEVLADISFIFLSVSHPPVKLRVMLNRYEWCQCAHVVLRKKINKSIIKYIPLMVNLYPNIKKNLLSF